MKILYLLSKKKLGDFSQPAMLVLGTYLVRSKGDQKGATNKMKPFPPLLSIPKRSRFGIFTYPWMVDFSW